MLLFLDFDGVLRPTTAPAGILHRRCLDQLQELLGEFPDVCLVLPITHKSAQSAWCERVHDDTRWSRYP